jgi:hypothetical protein
MTAAFPIPDVPFEWGRYRGGVPGSWRSCSVTSGRSSEDIA